MTLLEFAGGVSRGLGLLMLLICSVLALQALGLIGAKYLDRPELGQVAVPGSIGIFLLALGESIGGL